MSVETNLIARLFRENFQKQRKLYFIAIFAMILVAVTTALSAYVMGEIVNGMMVSRDLSRVYQIAVFILAIFLVKGFATYFQSLYMAKAGNRIIAEQQSRLFSFVLSQDAAFFQKYASSDFLTRITYNSQSVRQVIDIIVSSFVRDLFTLIGLVGVMIIQQPYLSIGSLTIGPIAFLGLRLLLKKVRHYMSLELLSITAMIHVVQETSLGIRIVKAFNLEDMLKARMNKTVLDIERQANRLARMEAATAPIMETLAGIAIAGMLALSGVLVLKYGQSPGELMSFITALLLAYEPAKRLARMRVTIEGGMVGVKGMFAMLDHPVTLVEKWDAKILAVKKGDIRFDAVGFSYVDTVPILDNVSVQFVAGKTTAIVGPSGAGKSTMINLIMRLYDPETGHISIDGIDLKDLTLQSLRQHIAYVGQETFLFSGTVRYNISLGRQEASEDDIIAAAKAANAHDFIMSLEKGYDTQVGEGGGNLSGGQRQRVTIARAFLRNAPILILDEPTSALDSESDALIGEALDKLSKGRTTIIVAHRLSTISNADHVIVLDHGKLVEQGAPTALFKRNGRFQKLFASQALLLE